MNEKLVYINDVKNRLNKAYGDGNLLGLDGVLDVISAVDAVAVVRCKDCKYAMVLRKPEGKLIADCWIRKMNSEDEQFCMVSGDDFCSWGERREDNAID